MKKSKKDVCRHQEPKLDGSTTTDKKYDSCLIQQAMEAEIMRKEMPILVPTRKKTHEKKVVDAGFKMASRAIEKGKSVGRIKSDFGLGELPDLSQ